MVMGSCASSYGRRGFRVGSADHSVVNAPPSRIRAPSADGKANWLYTVLVAD